MNIVPVGVKKYGEQKFVDLAKNGKMYKLFDRMAKDDDFFQQVLVGTGMGLHGYNAIANAAIAMANVSIPIEQRKYMASYDIISGGLNVVSIFSVGSLVNAITGPLVKKLLGSLREEPIRFRNAVTGVRSLITLGFSIVFVQRVLVTYVSVPLAQWFKNKYLGQNKDLYKQKAKEYKQAKKLGEFTAEKSSQKDKQSVLETQTSVTIPKSNQPILKIPHAGKQDELFRSFNTSPASS